MVATSADAKPFSVSAPPTPEIDHNLSPDYDHSDHANLERTLFDRLSSIHQTQGGSTFPSPAPTPSPSPLATNAKQQLEHAVEEESADLRSQMHHQVMDGFRLQLDAQRARQQAIESEQSEAMAAQAASISALSHISMHVEDKIAAGQQAVALLHAQFEQASEQAAQSSREQS
jgi:hypothetical protein